MFKTEPPLSVGPRGGFGTMYYNPEALYVEGYGTGYVRTFNDMGGEQDLELGQYKTFWFLGDNAPTEYNTRITDMQANPPTMSLTVTFAKITKIVSVAPSSVYNPPTQ